MKLALKLLEGRFAVCRFNADAPVPASLLQAHPEFLSITRTADELSIARPEELAPAGAKLQPGWRAFKKVEGLLDFSLTGIIAMLTAPLAEAGISVFTVATFDTDYLLVQAKDLEGAVAALAGASRVLR